jgi:hypothetical protein
MDPLPFFVGGSYERACKAGTFASAAATAEAAIGRVWDPIRLCHHNLLSRIRIGVFISPTARSGFSLDVQFIEPCHYS